MTIVGSGLKSDGTALDRDKTIPVTWKGGPWAPVKTETTTTLTCDVPSVFTGVALEPCTAVVTPHR